MSTLLEAQVLSLKEVKANYPDVSPFVILKIDVQRRGVVYTEKAIAQVDPRRHLTQVRGIFSVDGEKNTSLPVSLLLRDGTTICVAPNAPGPHTPYQVDFREGRLVLVDGEDVLEEVEFFLRPDFYDQVTRRGTPMWQVAAMVRPQRIDFNPYGNCHFWDDGKGCRYCNVTAVYRKASRESGRSLKVHPEDVFDTISEAIKQPGRFAYIVLTGGSIPGADNRFSEEVDVYIETLQALGRAFSTPRFPSQLIASAFPTDELERLYNQTGLSSYTTDLEVLDEQKFAWICPGKHERVGYREWKQRLIRAVDIFGRGNVNTGFVAGAELAKPYGFATEEDALAATLATAEELASFGVETAQTVWRPSQGSAFHSQNSPSLEFHVRLARELYGLHQRYGLRSDMDDYRRCGNHPNTDLARI